MCVPVSTTCSPPPWLHMMFHSPPSVNHENCVKKGCIHGCGPPFLIQKPVRGFACDMFRGMKLKVAACVLPHRNQHKGPLLTALLPSMEKRSLHVCPKSFPTVVTRSKMVSTHPKGTTLQIQRGIYLLSLYIYSGYIIEWLLSGKVVGETILDLRFNVRRKCTHVYMYAGDMSAYANLAVCYDNSPNVAQRKHIHCWGPNWRQTKTARW